MTLLTKKDLMARWAENGVPLTERTIRRRLNRFNIASRKVKGSLRGLKGFPLREVQAVERKAGIVPAKSKEARL